MVKERFSKILRTRTVLLFLKTRKQGQTKRHMMPILSDPVSMPIPSSMYLQNLHPGLAMFKSDLKTDKMSFEDLQHLCDFNNESELVKFLIDLGVLAQSQICTLCGSNMRQMNQANTIYLIFRQL